MVGNYFAIHFRNSIQLCDTLYDSLHDAFRNTPYNSLHNSLRDSLCDLLMSSWHIILEMNRKFAFLQNGS